MTNQDMSDYIRVMHNRHTLTSSGFPSLYLSCDSAKRLHASTKRPLISASIASIMEDCESHVGPFMSLAYLLEVVVLQRSFGINAGRFQARQSIDKATRD